METGFLCHKPLKSVYISERSVNWHSINGNSHIERTLQNHSKSDYHIIYYYLENNKLELLDNARSQIGALT